MNIAEVAIIAPSTGDVKGGNVSHHLRVSRDDAAV